MVLRFPGVTPTAYISGIGVFFYIFFPTRWRIVSVSTPGVASKDSAETLPGPPEGTVDRDGLDKIL
jgi:hypothetical protein